MVLASSLTILKLYTSKKFGHAHSNHALICSRDVHVCCCIRSRVVTTMLSYWYSRSACFSVFTRNLIGAQVHNNNAHASDIDYTAVILLNNNTQPASSCQHRNHGDNTHNTNKKETHTHWYKQCTFPFTKSIMCRNRSQYYIVPY